MSEKPPKTSERKQPVYGTRLSVPLGRETQVLVTQTLNVEFSKPEITSPARHL